MLKIKKSEIKDGYAKSFNVGEEKIIVCQTGSNYFALSNICSHDDGEMVLDLCKLVNDCQVECPRHGAHFDVKTGKATKMPAVVGISTYKVNEKGDELEIEVVV